MPFPHKWAWTDIHEGGGGGVGAYTFKIYQFRYPLVNEYTNGWQQSSKDNFVAINN